MLKITDVMPELVASMKAQQKEYYTSDMVDLIVTIVCRALHLDESNIRGVRSSSTYTDARRIIYHIMRIQLKMNWVEIGENFNRDHSTIIYSLRVYDQLVESRDRKFAQMIQTVTKELEELCD